MGKDDLMPTITEETIDRSGSSLPILVFTPEATGNHPAIVLSPEAYGVNEFTRGVASALTAEGYVVVVVDYYRGKGLSDPDNYEDFTEVMTFIEDLDFVQATHDVMAAIEYARCRNDVDADRVAVWGYCTGGTLALLAASLNPDLAAAVIFFPSQPTFPTIDAKRPVNAIDLLWNIGCPILILYGDQDFLADVMPEVGRRLEQWHIDHEIRVYEGAGHAFSAPVPPLRHDGADKASWADAVHFAQVHLGP
jgi:carboxymethylenebutenolidase